MFLCIPIILPCCRPVSTYTAITSWCLQSACCKGFAKSILFFFVQTASMDFGIVICPHRHNLLCLSVSSVYDFDFPSFFAGKKIGSPPISISSFRLLVYCLVFSGVGLPASKHSEAGNDWKMTVDDSWNCTPIWFMAMSVWGFPLRTLVRGCRSKGRPQSTNLKPGDLAAFKSRPLPSLYLGALQFVRDVAWMLEALPEENKQGFKKDSLNELNSI